MRAPPVPSTEVTRLKRLTGTGLLDSEAEERFDRITRIAQKVFQVPIALVSLVDAERQWFKSKQGVDASETPRDISFCGHAILEDGSLVVENATEDPRFDDNPLVVDGPLIRFYAGHPLRSADGHALATLCIIDTAPRRFSADDHQLLADLAAIAEGELQRSGFQAPDYAMTVGLP